VRIISSPYPAVNIPNVPLAEFVFARAGALADKTAIVCAATGTSYTYAQLALAVQRVAAGLHARGVKKGDVVGLVSPNTPDFAVAFYAITVIGAICSTVNPIATAEEIGAQFADSEAVMLFTIPEMFEKCSTASRLAATVREIVVFGEAPGAVPYAELFTCGDVPPAVSIDPANDVAVLPYSSGTSGIPKGVMLTHRNLVANLCQIHGSVNIVNETDTAIAVLPFFHIYGMVVVMSAVLHEGGTIVTMPRFELDVFLQTIQKYQVTVAFVVPPIILAMAKHPLVAQYQLSSLRVLFSGAAPLGAALASACADRLGVLVRQGYGLTETSPVTHSHPLDGDILEYASVGPALPNTECRVVDALTGEDVTLGEPGELWIRGPQVMKGYFNKPEATAACLGDDGWFHTGDVATVNEHGWFAIVDRVKELIKYKGLQVAPAELEALLLSHPAIGDAAVIPVPDDDAGEIPKAFIVARSEISADEVMQFVAERVSPYKKVRAVEFVDSIPKSPSGKILRRMLVEKERQASRSSL
jgi:acyl-CoA synthetase (AMP-forming)/AMP-acid ligase II